MAHAQHTQLRPATRSTPRALLGSTVQLREFLSGPGPRWLGAWLLGVSAFMALFSSSFLGAFHQPTPHWVPIAVVAPAPTVTTLQHKLNDQASGAFTLTRYGSVDRATTALRSATVDAVFVPPSTPTSASQSAEGGGRPVALLLTASALGKLPTQVITQTFTGIGKATGATVEVRDVVPLRTQDPFGISSFFFSIAVFLPSFIASVLLTVLFRRAPALARMVAIVALAGCLALIDVAVADAGLGALVGHPGTLIGVAVLASLAFTAPTVALGRLLGPPGAPVALLVFIILGLPASGGPFGTAFLPDFHRAFSPGLPLTNAVLAVRNITYFGGDNLSGPLGILAIWAGSGLLALAVISLVEKHLTPSSSARQPTTAGAQVPSSLSVATSGVTLALLSRYLETADDRAQSQLRAALVRLAPEYGSEGERARWVAREILRPAARRALEEALAARDS